MPDEALRDCQRQSASRSRTIILLSLLANHKQAAQCPLLGAAGAFTFERCPRHGFVRDTTILRLYDCAAPTISRSTSSRSARSATIGK